METPPITPSPAPTPAPIPEEPKKNNTVLYIVIGVVVLCICCACIGGIWYLYQNGDQLFGTGARLLQQALA